MTIWLLALILLAALAAVGYSQGAIRVSFSLIGIVVGALLAMPLARYAKLILPPLGVVNPLLIWALAPFIVFVVVQILFKVAGLAVHKKVEVYYKYKAGDLRLSLWDRLNRRVGACLGLVNGAVYLVLIALVIYPFSYLTAQMASSDQDSKLVRILNAAGRDVVSTGLVKAVVALDPVPQPYYSTVDILGLLYNDVRVHGRLGRYPLFMHLAEEQQFQQIAADKAYTEMFVRHDPMGAVVGHPNTRAILDNPDLLRRVWDLTLPNLQDLRTYLETGKSPKYDPLTILGHWSFDAHAAMLALKRNTPSLTTSQMKLLKQFYYPAMEKARFVAYPDNKAVLKGVVRFNWGAKPQPAVVAAASASAPAPIQPVPSRPGSPGDRYNVRGRGPAAAPVMPLAPGPTAPAAAAAPVVSEPLELQGKWQNVDGKYRLSFSGGRNVTFEAVVEGDRLTMTGEREPLVFESE